MKKSVKDIDVKGKRCLVRADFNVPQDKSGNITEDLRIVEALPTIKYLIENGAKVVLCSHLGRPKGEDKARFTLAPVAKKLSEFLGKDVPLMADCIGDDIVAKTKSMADGDVILLENVRYYSEEEKNEPNFAKSLSLNGDIFVNDAFGTAHRAHASTAGLADYLPAVCGFLIDKEISIMGGALQAPKRPFVAILGGAKVSDKIAVIENLIDKVDKIVIGGAMSYTFVAANGGKIGKSLCETDKFELARELEAKAKAKGVEFLLPTDALCTDSFDSEAEPVTYQVNEIPDDMMGLDIGADSIKLFEAAVKDAGTVVWNGPMGVFEKEKFNKGTYAVAKAMTASDATTIIGGGDSAAAAISLGFKEQITHISTGGGASLEFLEGKELPGIACLQDK